MGSLIAMTFTRLFIPLIIFGIWLKTLIIKPSYAFITDGGGGGGPPPHLQMDRTAGILPLMFGLPLETSSIFCLFWFCNCWSCDNA